jgi:hypothetical protein
MSAEQEAKAPQFRVTCPYGGCPQCGETNGYCNTGPGQHWFVCDEHRTKWRAPAKQFLSWRGEHHSTWKQHEIETRAYRSRPSLGTGLG